MFIAIKVTISECGILTGGRIYQKNVFTGEEKVERVSYRQGMKALRMAEKKLNKTAALIVNYYDKSICYKEIHGFIE